MAQLYYTLLEKAKEKADYIVLRGLWRSTLCIYCYAFSRYLRAVERSRSIRRRLPSVIIFLIIKGLRSVSRSVYCSST